jgi:hypothetical protein
MTKAIIIVQSDPQEGREQEYRDWYVGQHLHDVAALPGFVRARFFEASEAQRDGVPRPEYRHLAIYELEVDAATGIATLDAARDNGLYVSPAMKSERLLHVFDLAAEVSP